MWAAIPVVVALWYLDGANWVRFRRVATRIRDLEGLFQAYVSALRETDVVRPDAIRQFRRRVDHYQFGIERTLKVSTRQEVWKVNHSRLRWWLYGAVAVMLVLAGLL